MCKILYLCSADRGKSLLHSAGDDRCGLREALRCQFHQHLECVSLFSKLTSRSVFSYLVRVHHLVSPAFIAGVLVSRL